MKTINLNELQQVTSRDMHSKLDPYAYLVLSHAPYEKISVLFETKGPLTDENRLALTVAGMELHSNVGSIHTGMVEVAKLEAVCDFDFIVRVEVSRPLHPN